MNKNKHFLLFIEKLNGFLESKELIKLTISNPRDRSSDLKSIIINIVQLKSGFRLNFNYHYKTKDITKNFGFTEAVNIIEKALETDFYNADLFAENQTIHLAIAKNGSAKLRIKEAALAPVTSFSHDKKKGKAHRNRRKHLSERIGYYQC